MVGCVLQMFGLTFEISSEVYGQVRSQPLKEGGANIAVSKDNREEFVDLYVDFIFNKSIESKFVAFYNGFYKVGGQKPTFHISFTPLNSTTNCLL